MAYHVYKVFSSRRPEPVSSFEHYAQARQLARQMRAELTEEDDFSVRVVFARSDEEAVRLLTEKREAPPLGDE